MSDRADHPSPNLSALVTRHHWRLGNIVERSTRYFAGELDETDTIFFGRWHRHWHDAGFAGEYTSWKRVNHSADGHADDTLRRT